MKRIIAAFCCVLLAVMVGGCVAARLHHDGIQLVESGKIEEGMMKLAQAVERAPTNPVYRTDLLHQREAQLEALLSAGRAQREANHWDEASILFGRARSIAPLDPRPQDALSELARAHSAELDLTQAQSDLRRGDVEHARSLINSVIARDPTNVVAIKLSSEIEEARTQVRIESPVLNSRGKMVSLHFINASVRSILEAIGRSAGLSILLDQDIRPDLLTSIGVDRMNAEDAITFVTQTSHLRSKVLDENTVMVYPSTPEKVRDYEDLVVKAFYLGDADAKRTEALLKGFLRAEDIFVDEKRNLVVMRAPIDQIKLAEKLVALDDVKQPEVMLEVQVMEVNRSRLTELGVSYPNQATFSLIPPSSGTTTLADYKNLSAAVIGLVIPSTVVNLNKLDSDADLLANPRIRVRNRQQAKILIGDKLPVVTSTATSTGFVSENIQYLDVGLKLDVEPDISIDGSVSINLSLEVSSVANQITTPGGSLAYQIGTRTASTVLELRDGETEVLAGLISDNDTRAAQKIPGLGDLPILGRLFSTHKNDHQKSEIILAITPRIVRGYRPSLTDDSQFWSGTANRPGTQPLILHHAHPSTASSSVETGRPAALSPDASHAPNSPEAVPDAATLTFDWQGPATVKQGDTFTISVHIRTDGAIYSLPLQVAYDKKALEVVSIQQGGFFKREASQSLFTDQIDPANGRLIISTGTSGTEGSAGEGSVATVTLRAVAANARATIALMAASPLLSNGQPLKATLPESYAVKITP